MKRFAAVITAILLLLAAVTVSADFEDAESAKQSVERGISASNVYVCDSVDVENAYFVRNEHTRVAPASTTKIMTCVLALESCDLDEPVTVPDEGATLGGDNSEMGLAEGETLRMEDLLYGLMLRSANDAANTIAIHIGGSIEGFTALMNEKAQALGLSDTRFTNPRGVNREGHYSSAYDMAVLTRYAMQNEVFRTVVRTKEYNVPSNDVRRQELTFTNRNRLISDRESSSCYYRYAVGVKTGTSTAGCCLVSAATREDVTVICVQLGMTGMDTDAHRHEELCRDAKAMFEYIFNYEYSYVRAKELIGSFRFEVGLEGSFEPLKVYAQLEGLCCYRPNDEIELLRQGDAEFETACELYVTAAPIEAGSKVGAVTFSYGGRAWYTAELYAQVELPLSPTPSPTVTPAPTPNLTAEPTAEPSDTPTYSPFCSPAPMVGRKDGNALIWVFFAGLAVALGLIAAAIILFASGTKRGGRRGK
ncbi:MAG TPA: serine hydrolase [Eubacteriales bacterium]|nr:serine hydrolase [Clostridia bacterium]HRV73791.1 serine hydrolase [Eubacteriales bacterium]